MWNLSVQQFELSRTARQRAKATDKVSRELANRTQIGLEPLEPRMLLAGLPTLIDIVAGAGESSPAHFTRARLVYV